ETYKVRLQETRKTRWMMGMSPSKFLVTPPQDRNYSPRTGKISNIPLGRVVTATGAFDIMVIPLQMNLSKM
ncbi:hypothetical protein KCA24_03025, partial [Escherichia coli]|nr:hypothetical protein [Escherichia coli]